MTAEEYFQQGNEYRKKGDLSKAMNCYLEAIALEPESPALEAKKNVGRCIQLLQQGRIQSLKYKNNE